MPEPIEGAAQPNNDVAQDAGKAQGAADPKAEGQAAGKAAEQNADQAGADKGKEAPPKADDKKGKESAPEQYSAFKMPEGMDLKPDLLAKFSEMAKGYGLSQEKAQGMVDLAIEHAEIMKQAQAEAWQGIRETWVKEIKEDKEYGGQKFNETLTRAQRTLSKFGSDAMVDFLRKTGYGDNPEVIKMLARIDSAMGEDKTIDGRPAGDAVKSAAEVLYPNQGKA